MYRILKHIKRYLQPSYIWEYNQQKRSYSLDLRLTQQFLPSHRISLIAAPPSYGPEKRTHDTLLEVINTKQQGFAFSLESFLGDFLNGRFEHGNHNKNVDQPLEDRTQGLTEILEVYTFRTLLQQHFSDFGKDYKSFFTDSNLPKTARDSIRELIEQ